MRRTLAGLAACLLVALGTLPALAAVAPDKQFGGDGSVVLPLLNGYFADVTTTGNQVVAAGTNGFDTIVVAKYTQGGQPVSSFANNGVRAIDLGDYYNPSGFVAIDSQDRILAGGAVNSGVAVVRLLPDGSRDSTFGTNGVATYTNSGVNYAIAIDHLDRPVISYSDASSLADKRLHVIRLTVDGEPDPTFAGDGDYKDSVISSARIGGIAVDANDRVILLADVFADGGGRAVDVLRIDAEGAALTSLHRFSEAGLKNPRSIAASSDGSIIGAISATKGPDFLIFRLTVDGTPDTSFSEDGRLPGTCPMRCLVDDVLVHPDGSTSVGGTLIQHDFATTTGWIGHVKASGTWSRLYARDGMRTVDLFNADESVDAIASDKDGRLVIAGSRYSDHGDGYVARLTVS